MQAYMRFVVTVATGSPTSSLPTPVMGNSRNVQGSISNARGTFEPKTHPSPPLLPPFVAKDVPQGVKKWVEKIVRVCVKTLTKSNKKSNKTK